MDSTTVEQVVGKLADKIGVAAETLVPVAEEALRQIALRGMMFTFLGIGGILVFVPLGIWALHKFQSSDDEPWVALVIMAVVFSLFSVAAIACGLNGWVAPLPKLLGV